MTTTQELPGLIDRICSTHHAFLREVLPRLNQDLRALRDHPDAEVQQRWQDVFKAFFGLKMEIEEHLMKEEQILFPTIKTLASGTGSGPAGCGVAPPVQQMKVEHENARRALDTIASLCVSLSAGSGPLADEATRALADLAALDKDLREHIRVEEEELFPTALTLEP